MRTKDVWWWIYNMCKPFCKECGKKEIRCKGLCSKCYFRQHNKEYYQKYKERIKQQTYENKRQNNWYYNEHTNEYHNEFNKIPINSEKNKVRAKTRYYHVKLGICEECRLVGYTEFHHVGKYHPDNVKEVCKECHKKYHH